MFGEVFDGRDDLVGSYTFNRELDGLFDFPQYFSVFRDVFIGGKPTTQIQQRWTDRKTNWSPEINPEGIGLAPIDTHVNFLDNHDVGRFLYWAQQAGRTDARGVLWNALTFQLTEDGIPCVYYGTEQEFSGGNDPANREDLWPSGFATDGATFQRIARLTRIRKAYAPFRRGDLRFAWTTDRVADEPDAGIVAIERTMPTGEYALVVINTNGNHASSPQFNGDPMKVNAPPGTVLVDVLPESGGQTYTVTSDGKLSISLPPTSAAVLVPQGTKI
jgi:glycosidase